MDTKKVASSTPIFLIDVKYIRKNNQYEIICYLKNVGLSFYSQRTKNYKRNTGKGEEHMQMYRRRRTLLESGGSTKQ